MASNNNGRTASESFKAQALVYRHMYGILDSMCLKWIVDFRIPNIIHNHGKPITLLELVSVLKIPSAKVDSTDLFMHYMAHNGFFDIVTIHGDDDSNQEEEEKEAFALTAASELLIKGTENPSISPVVEMFLDDPTLSSSIHHLNKWFYDENRPLYEITLGKPLWEFLDKNPANLSLFNDAMASDSQMIKLALKDHNMVFEGLETIVDVGGGNGTTALIISEKFPALKWIVFDLPQVVKNLKGFNNLSFVGGDMFDSIPKADAILLKLVLHNWSDDNCVKILRNCKDAVNTSSKIKNKGKIIILEAVINEEQDEPEITRLKFLMNISMHIILHGKERTKKEWESIFYEAGLYNYKISPFTGHLSLIEVYP
ncbi:Isoflavone 7-O-methyltransferase [Arachis hypogaea]|nr:Isoflavone 7-O-methyltransferase [Arachis hypogaea]